MCALVTGVQTCALPIYGEGGIREDVVPCRKWLVGGNGERVAVVAVGDELEQGAGFDLVLADVGQIVEHDEIELVELVEHGGQAEVAARGLELLDHVGGGAEQDAPPRVDEGMANGGKCVGLAGPGLAEPPQVAAVPVPGTGRAAGRERGWP